MNKSQKIILSFCLIVIMSVTAVLPISAKVVIEEVGASIFPSRFMPAQGKVNALVIPVEFIDFRFQEDPIDTLDEMFNGSGTVYAPSVKEYFSNASYGEMQFSAQVQSVVRLSNTRKSYNGNHAQLIQELLEILDEEGLDLTQFDQNNDGVLDGLYIIWAGAHILTTKLYNEVFALATVFRKLWNDFAALQIALLLRKDAAAVFLHIKAQLPGSLLAGLEIGTEIPVFKLHPEFSRRPLGNIPHQLMVLVRADKQ